MPPAISPPPWWLVMVDSVASSADGGTRRGRCRSGRGWHEPNRTRDFSQVRLTARRSMHRRGAAQLNGAAVAVRQEGSQDLVRAAGQGVQGAIRHRTRLSAVFGRRALRHVPIASTQPYRR